MPEFKTAAVFSDNMVLQQGKNIAVFGSGEENKRVTVTMGSSSVNATVKDGEWKALLPPADCADGLTMTISCGGEKIVFSNIAVGEVWLAGGQSNMEWELQSCPQGEKALAEDKNPNVRFYYTPKNAFFGEKHAKDEAESRWKLWGDDCGCWSAAGYFFAKRIAAEKGVTVGVIGCNWGGTSASNWVSRDLLNADADLKIYVDEYDEAVKGRDNAEMKREWDEYEQRHNAWYDRMVAFYEKNPDATWEECNAICGEDDWPGPKCPYTPFRPEGLYRTMFMRLCPYTLAGFIWYQGESDDFRADMYYKLFSRLIGQWRDNWCDDELPFLFCQLTMHRYTADPDWKNWCVVREAQEKVMRTIKNTAMACIIDCGEFNEIHPKDKLTVGERLAALALRDVYGKSDLTAYAPRYKSYTVSGSEMLLRFSGAESGFVLKNAELAKGFEVAGDDGVFYEADAALKGDKIVVKASEVAEPRSARYLWYNWAEVCVFAGNGLPLSPFVTK